MHARRASLPVDAALSAWLRGCLAVRRCFHAADPRPLSHHLAPHDQATAARPRVVSVVVRGAGSTALGNNASHTTKKSLAPVYIKT